MLLPKVVNSPSTVGFGTDHSNYLFETSDAGPLGPLLPDAFIEDVYKQAYSPSKFSRFDHLFEEISELRAAQIGGHFFFLRSHKLFPVSLRFDPCFPMVTDDDSQCLRQLRIVWQPDGHEDAALHTLYNLSKDTFSKTLAELLRLKKESGMTYDGKLDVHPILAKEGVNGPFAKGLAALIKSIAGKENLVNVAFFTIAPGGRSTQNSLGPWRFGGLDNHSGHLEPRTILNTKFQKQDIAGLDGASRSITADSIMTLLAPPAVSLDSPAIKNQSPLYPLGIPQAATEIVFDESNSIGAQAPEDFDKSYDFLLATSNPHLTSITNRACADCHVGAQEVAAMEVALPT